MKFLKIIFGFWYFLACMMMVMDVASFYEIMGGNDNFQLINREYDVQFVFAMIYLPVLLFGIYKFVTIKHSNTESFRNEIYTIHKQI